jgi:hypothetical protein
MCPRLHLKCPRRQILKDTLLRESDSSPLAGEHGKCRATETKTRIVMSKPKSSAPPSAGGNAAPTDQPTFRTNPEVDAKIDAYIKDNPKYWAYVQAMPRERLERTVVLNEVRELDRQQRIREGVLKQINRNPELKRAYDLLVKDLPEDQKESVIAQIGRTARRAVARVQGQQQGKTQAVGV